MKLEYYPQEKLKKEIKEIVGKYLDVTKYKVFFFGSRVDGSSHERSDIDVGIEGPQEISAVDITNIKEDIDKLIILYKIDVVDFKTLVGSDFYEVAKQKIEVF